MKLLKMKHVILKNFSDAGLAITESINNKYIFSYQRTLIMIYQQTRQMERVTRTIIFN